MKSKNNSIKAVISLFVLSILVGGCGSPKGSHPNPINLGETLSAKGIFLIDPLVDKIGPGKTSVKYKVLNAGDRSPVDTSEVTLTVKFGMPTMPDMVIPDAEVTALDDGVYEIGYFFAHGGKWRTNFTWSKDGAVLDTLALDYDLHINASRSFSQTIGGMGGLKSEDGLFSFSPSVTVYHPGSVKVQYRVLDEVGNFVDLSQYQIKVAYGMPSMPNMLIPDAVIKVAALGSLDVSYFFAHGGNWRKHIGLWKNGKLVDRLVYDFVVKH